MLHGPREKKCAEARGLLLLAGDRLGLALAGARIGVRALAADRQALAVAKTTIAGEIHQALDVHRHLAAEVTLDRVVGVDRLTNVQHFLVSQVLDARRVGDAELCRDFLGLGRTDAVDIGQRDNDALVGRDVNTRDTCHELGSPAPRAPAWLHGAHLLAMIRNAR